jgi:GTPase Era involved in 16S rRNA processing
MAETRRSTVTGMADPQAGGPQKIKQMLFVLVGPTRAGKSTFINTILGRQVAEEGASKSYYSTTRDIVNYCELTANSTHQKVLNSCIPNDGNTQLILNFMDTIGLGDVKVEYTDEEI